MNTRLGIRIVAVLLLLGLWRPAGAGPLPEGGLLLLTSDYGVVTRATTLKEMEAVADLMASARQDLQAIDAAHGDLCFFPTATGAFRESIREAHAGFLEQGVDPYGLFLKLLRERGVPRVLASMRMNDHHGQEQSWTPWQRAHVHWSLGRESGDRNGRSIGALRKMDYAQEGVRARHLAILAELLERYPLLDGLQLDFNRSAPFLSDPKAEKAVFLTRFVRDTRALLDAVSQRDGRPLLLGALVPWDLDFCAAEGLDVAEWIRSGLLDYVSPGEWYYTDPNIDIASWARLVRGTSCRLAPFMLGNVSQRHPWHGGQKPMLGEQVLLAPDVLRAVAENYRAQGAHGTGFYNFYATRSRWGFGALYPHLRDWTDPDTLRTLPRVLFTCRRSRYTPTEQETFREARAFDRYRLGSTGASVEVSLFLGAPALPDGSSFLLKVQDAEEDDAFTVEVNGEPLPSPSWRVLPPDPDTGRTFSVGIAAWPAALPPWQRGANRVRVRLERAGGDWPTRHVDEFEIRVAPDPAGA